MHHFYFPDISHLQPLAALARSATWQPLARSATWHATWQPLAPSATWQPLAPSATWQPLAPAATSSSSHVPAIWQPLAANLKKSEIYKITFFPRWHLEQVSAKWLPSGCPSKWLQVAAKWLPSDCQVADRASGCQVAAKWLPEQVAAKWLQVAASGCQVLA